MSGRGSRKRGRPPKTPNERATGKFNYQLLKKPKYLSKACDSQASTPSASRASSPQESDGSRSNNNNRRGTSKRGRGRKSHVNSNASYSSRKGYESEYHYGSDFGESEDDKSDGDDELLMSPSDEDSLDAGNETESEFSVCSFTQNGVGRPPRPPSPEPIWLQEGREFPALELPESSEDLFIGNEHVLRALSIYEVLRRFRHLVRLSPFRFEDFSAALVCEEQSALLTDVHIMLLKAILREEDAQGTHFGPLDQKDSVNISLYLIDSITWPEVLRIYVESDQIFDRKVYNILSTGEYPYTGVEHRLDVMQFLTDQFLTTNAVRDVMLQEGPIHYDDHCRVCHRLGDLLCCETCPAVYHLECVDPPMADVPTEDWQCGLCKSHKVTGVVDCVLPQEKQGVLIRHDILGLDRHGRKFWFIARRIFVEDQLTNECWYYSTTSKFELLLSRIDSEELESRLHTQLTDRKDEIVRQLQLTETITSEHKNNRKSVIELENEATMRLLNKDSGDDMDTENDSTEEQADSEPKKDDDSKIITRQKLTQLNNGTFYFKLGMEGAYKTYVNQYATNPIALNKPQRNEERDKRRHLSHKFSLTTASEFKWVGITMGTSDNIITTLRQTLMNLESNIAIQFMNPNWIAIKKFWNTALANSRRASDFAAVLLLIQSSLKSVVFANVWHEQLGHITFRRITSAEREDRKKQEKREKRERDDEEERNRLAYNYIKYTLGLKHQVWKQKGEEYRVHGQWGWLWLSSCRRCGGRQRRSNNTVRGQSLPHNKVYVHYTLDGGNVNEVALVDPRTQRFILQCDAEVAKGKKCHYLSDTYKDVHVVNDETKIDGVINVSQALTTGGRVLYPKVARKSRLDELLDRRMKLQDVEQKLATKTEDDEENTTLVKLGTESNQAKQTLLEKRILRLVDPTKGVQVPNTNINLDLVNSLAKKIQSVRLQFSQLNRFGKTVRCYTKGCNTNSNAVAEITQNTCYSPLCLQKARAKKELLLLLRKAHTAGNGSKETVAAILGAVKKPSILEQKLTEGKRSVSVTIEESDENKPSEEPPLDLMQDWEQARSSAVPYNEEMWKACFLTTEELATTNIKREDGSGESTRDSDKLDYMESMDVCSNVEIESTEDSMAASTTTSITEDAEPTSQRKKKTQKPKKAYIGTKDVLDQTLDKDIPLNKQNRRFPITPRPPKREDVTKYEREYYPNGKERVYSTESPRGRIYLLKDIAKLYELNVKTEDKNPVIVKKLSYSKYPLIPSFLTHKQKRSLLVLAHWELLKLARVGGKLPASGFHHLAKNNCVWPYQCSRPLFRTCWQYRTSCATTLSAIALQLRILWTCLRWDDMIAKPPSADGKHQVSTETEIVTLELLKLRHTGRYGEKTSYLRRKVVIPLEMPKTIREVTSIRSGLRKRKRAESPQPTEPQITEEWVDEDKLELWEIKFIGEKQEKARQSATTRSVALRQANEANNSGTGSPISSNGGSSRAPLTPKQCEEVKEKMEQQLRLQRAVNQRKTIEVIKSTPTAVKGQVVGSRRVIVKNPDGTTRIIQQAVTQVQRPGSNGTQVTTTTTTTAGTSQSSTSSSSSPASQPHKVQIIRGPDGKVSVRGLNPGQQLIQMPDGKLHVLTTTTSSAAGSQQVKSKLPLKAQTPSTSQSSSPVIKQIAVKHVGKPSTIQTPMQKVAAMSQVKNKIISSPQTIQKIASSNVVTSTATSTTTTKLANNAQNLQQVIVQGGQKLIVGQNAQGQKVIISAAPPTTTASAGGNTVQQQVLNTASPVTQIVQAQQPTQAQQQVIVNQVAPAQQATQKVIQHIVNTSNVQQQIVVGGQRIILSPGQTIVTQRNVPQSQAIQMVQQQLQQQQQQTVPQQQQTTQIIMPANQAAQLQHAPQAKTVKQIVLQQQSPQPQQQLQQQILQQPLQQQQIIEEKVQTQQQTSSTTTTTTQHTATISANNQQIVIQNSTLAQQLAQGKLQVATINGQQVIIKPIGSNQAQIVAHIKTQSDGNAHIVTNSAPESPQASPQKQQMQVAVQQQVLPQSPQPHQQQQQQIIMQQSPVYNDGAQQQQQQQPQQQQQQMSVEESLLQGQPPGTVIKCVTAQVIQTDQGPRIVLQGLVGNDFTQQQLALVQQQVKQQLLKAQESNGKHGVLGPTKIYLAVQPSADAVVNSQPPPLTPVHQSSNSAAQQQTVVDNAEEKKIEVDGGAAMTVVVANATEDTSAQEQQQQEVVKKPEAASAIAKCNEDELLDVGSPESNLIKQKTTNKQEAFKQSNNSNETQNEENDKQDTLLQVNQSQLQTNSSSSNMLEDSTNNNTSTANAANINTTTPIAIATAAGATATTTNAATAINTAATTTITSNIDLDQTNAIIDSNTTYVTIANTGTTTDSSNSSNTNNNNSQEYNINNSNNDIDDMLETTTTIVDGGNTTTSTDSIEEEQEQQTTAEDNFVVTSGYIKQSINNALKKGNLSPEVEEKLVHLQKQQQQNECSTTTPSKGEGIATTPVGHKSSVLQVSTVKKRYSSNNAVGYHHNNNNNNNSKVLLRQENNVAAIKLSEGKSAQLERQKDLLKKNILRKRSLLERNLQNEIKEEVAAKISTNTTAATTTTTATTVATISTTTSTTPGPMTERQAADKSKSDDRELNEQTGELKRQIRSSTNRQNLDLMPQPTRHGVGRPKKSGRKKEKLYCICRTPYDDTKFYVGCDLCSNWFHGECVKITEEASKRLSEFICEDCKKARETQQLYCSCRQPYDESQFYICCDKCQDWFHGRCVGILQSEAEFIDEYICPECQRNTDVNVANTKSLSDAEMSQLRLLIQQIQEHKSAWPFKEPVDPEEAPDYYKIIKEPMDLKKIEARLDSHGYSKLSEFIGDMTKMFDNCRYYNPKESSFYKCAESLESYFVQKIKNFRETVVGHSSN